MLHIYDTATQSLTPLTTRTPGEVSIYVCGPTVYDLPHLGHGRAGLVYDILRRYLEYRGFRVHHVSNVTDIDDKIIQKASSEGRSPAEVASEFEGNWWEAMDALGILRPTATPHATDYVEEMIELIEALVEKGVAYRTSTGVYMSVEAVPGYGLLAHQPLDSLRSGARVSMNEEKHSPLDFALWKLAKPGEPAWSSPWGMGRPGWHTECVVMSLGILGEDFDIHAGGMDLQFPHHENERAQALSLSKKFARHWIHHAFVEVGGEKMSKSLGNFTSLPDLLQKYDPRAYRLLVLRSHYRSPMEVTERTMVDAQEALARLDALARRFEIKRGAGRNEPVYGTVADEPTSPPTDRISASQEVGEISSHLPSPSEEGRRRFIERMDDDLDTPGAVAVLFDLVRQANTAADSGDLTLARSLVETVEELSRAVGLDIGDQEEKPDNEIQALVDKRSQARLEKNFVEADAIREQLSKLGWQVEDTPDGPVLHRKLEHR